MTSAANTALAHAKMPALSTTALEPLVQMSTQKRAMQSNPNGFHSHTL